MSNDLDLYNFDFFIFEFSMNVLNIALLLLNDFSKLNFSLLSLCSKLIEDLYHLHFF